MKIYHTKTAFTAATC